MKTSIFLSMMAFLWSVTHTGHAQQFTIGSFTIDGGGGTSTNTTYTLSGTIGQPDAGSVMSGGAYAVQGGFWAGAYAVQGLAALWIRRLDGSYSGVMGLPLFETGEALAQAGFPML